MDFQAVEDLSIAIYTEYLLPDKSYSIVFCGGCVSISFLGRNWEDFQRTRRLKRKRSCSMYVTTARSKQ